MKKINTEDEIKKLLGKKVEKMFIKIANQLAKVDKLEKEIEEIKKRLDND